LYLDLLFVVLLEQRDIGKKFPEATFANGETCFNFLVKYGKQRGFIMLTDTDGKLLFTVGGKYKASEKLKEGRNISKIRMTQSTVKTHSHYVVKTQQKVDPDTNSWTTKTCSVRSTAKDENVFRYRPKLLQAETDMNKQTAQEYVNYLAQVSAGKSIKVVIDYPGWKQKTSDTLWRENLLVAVESPTCKLSTDMLIEEVMYTLDNSGIKSQLTLVYPDTYNINPRDTISSKNKSISASKYGWTSNKQTERQQKAWDQVKDLSDSGTEFLTELD